MKDYSLIANGRANYVKKQRMLAEWTKLFIAV